MAEVTSKTIEELQAENAELTHIFELQRRRERPWIEKWQTETGKHNCLPDYGAMLGWLCDRAERPIDILLFCPRCAEQHIDEPQPMKGWDNPPHRSHECQTCGYVWRPADVPTNGVQEIQSKGKLDQDPMPRRSLAEIEAQKKKGGGMTAAELQDQIVRLLANNNYCRYWLNWPSFDGKQWMAVSILQVDDRDRAYFQECSELEAKGFTKEIYNGAPLYKIERT